MAKDIAELKAVSKNLMHANISTTDGIYGILSETDVREQVASLGRNISISETGDISELITLVKEIVRRVERKQER